MTNDTVSLGNMDDARKWAWPFDLRADRLPGVHKRSTLVLYEGEYRTDGFIYSRTKRPRRVGFWRVTHRDDRHWRSGEKTGRGLKPAKIEDIAGLLASYERALAQRRKHTDKRDLLGAKLSELMGEHQVTKCFVVVSKGREEDIITIRKENNGLSRSHCSWSELEGKSDLERLGMTNPAFQDVGSAYDVACSNAHRAYMRQGRVARWLHVACVRCLPRADRNNPYGWAPPPRLAHVELGDWRVIYRTAGSGENNPNTTRLANSGWVLQVMYHKDDAETFIQKRLA